MINEHCIVVLNLDRQTSIGLAPVIISTAYVVGFDVVELSSMELHLISTSSWPALVEHRTPSLCRFSTINS